VGGPWHRQPAGGRRIADRVGHPARRRRGHRADRLRRGCAPKLTGENSGYRQAGCVTADDRFTITTFTTDQGQRDWLAEALPYGGAYLVGLRWIVSANTRTGLAPLAARLGGTILDQTAQHHS